MVICRSAILHLAEVPINPALLEKKQNRICNTYLTLDMTEHPIYLDKVFSLIKNNVILRKRDDRVK